MRRPKGEGSITRRADGSYMGRRWVHSHGGLRRHCVYGRTQKDVAAKLDALEADNAQLLTPADAKVTLRDFTTRWLAGAEIRPSTRRSYHDTMQRHVLPFLGHVPVRQLTPLRLEAWKQQRLEAGAKRASIRYARVVLRAALSQAIRWHLCATNAAQRIAAVKVERKIYPVPTAEQLVTLLTALNSHRLEAAIRLGVLGLRIGEVLGASWLALDLDAGTLDVRQALTAIVKDGKQVLELSPPKSDASRRLVPLPGSVVDALRQRRQAQREERLQAGGTWKDWQEASLVFTSATGRPWHPRNLLRDYQRLLTQLGLPTFTFHALRHGCATLLLLEGEQPRVVADLLGHSDVRLTLAIYQGRVERAVRGATERLEAALKRF
jgi:integrase